MSSIMGLYPSCFVKDKGEMVMQCLHNLSLMYRSVHFTNVIYHLVTLTLYLSCTVFVIYEHENINTISN